MKPGTFLLILLSASAMLPALILKPALGSAVICVSPTDSGCLPRVQDGVNAAFDGDTVEVRPGVYRERVNITKSITLVAQDPDPRRTVIDGFGNGSVLHVVRASNVAIRGFTIQNGFRGIHLSSVNGGTISGNVIVSNSGYGIRVFNAAGVSITGNTVSSNFRGISLSSNLAGNTITLNTVSSNVYGIRLFNSSQNTVASNTVYNNNRGLALLNASNYNSITDNTVSLNTEYGIGLRSSIGNSILRNTLTNNLQGIDVFRSGGNILRNNRLSGPFYNFGVDGDTLADFLQDIDTSNTVNSKPVHYLVEQNGLVIDPLTLPSIGFLGIVSSTDVTVSDLVLSNNIQGLLFAYTSGSRITRLQASNNFQGIMMVNSPGNVLTDNQVTSNGHYGIFLHQSGNNLLRRNIMTGNRFNFGAWSTTLTDFVQDIDTTNTVDQRPVYYLVNQRDKQVPADAGYVAAINSENITVKDLKLTRNYSGALLAYTTNSRIQNVNASENQVGIFLTYSRANNVSSSIASYNVFRGIYVHNSTRNFLGYNKVTSNTDVGVRVHWYSSDNTLRENIVSSNGYGVSIADYSDNNMIRANRLTNNIVVGMNVTRSSNNLIYNNFFNNTSNARDDGQNLWNIAKTPGNNIVGTSFLGGNFWQDYAGADTNGDGLGDTLTPYTSIGHIINGGDSSPLILPGYTAPIVHDVTVSSLTASPTSVVQGGIVSIAAVVKNEGNVLESFNVNAYFNGTMIGSQTVTSLAPGGSRTLSFTWDTTGVTLTRFFSLSTIRVSATIVAGENDTLDNAMAETVKIVLAVDLDRFFILDWADYDNNGIVDILDVAVAAFVFGQPNSYWDLNLGGSTDIVDLATIAFYFGQSFGLASYPSQRLTPGRIDQEWIGFCNYLLALSRAYCLARI